MLVRMKVSTRHNGPVFAGDIITVDDATGKKWVSKNIAEEVFVEKEVQEEIEDIVGQDVEPKLDPVEPEATPVDKFEGMTAKQLYEQCLSLGIEVEQKQAKQVYLDLLKK